jgi:phage terminase large subunit GpA-like protein
MKMASEERYNSIGSIALDMGDTLRPPQRLTVASAAEKYRHLNNPGSYVGPWMHATTPYLVEPMESLTDRDHDAVVFVGPAQSGKALAVDTPIATPTGWTNMGGLQAGDEIFDERGKPCRVTFVTGVMQDRVCYEVAFDDGEVIVADAEHLWAVNDTWGAGKTVTTDWLKERYRIAHRKTGKARYRFSIPVTAPLDTPKKALPIPPYVLGAWLGDGACHTAHFTLNTYDAEDITRMCAEHGWRAKEHFYNGQGSRDFTLWRDGVSLHSVLKKHIGAKHIPEGYLRASRKQRLDLLAGLLDTDGGIEGGSQCFSTSSAVLAGQVAELLSTLGIKFAQRSAIPFYTYKGERKQGQLSYSLDFTSSHCYLRASRKVAMFNAFGKKRRDSHTTRRWIRDIRLVESVPVKCITVDSSSRLYLCGKGMVPTHNTEITLNWINHSVICDPMDMIVYDKSQVSARDFSKRRVDRMHRHSPEVGARMIQKADADNVFDKIYKSGMILTLSWPSIAELSGRPVGRVAQVDYDRMPEDVDGEGSPFDLGRKRTTTFGSSAMTLAESSPGYEITDTKWMRRTPHEAPPSKGILSLYNRGDRRRWYWHCEHCREWFEPEFSLLKWVEKEDAVATAKSVHLMCPHCQVLIPPSDKARMNRQGRWVSEGLKIRRDGSLEGTPVRSDIISYWLKGPAAAFAPWHTLVSRYLAAEQEFLRTGSQEALKATVNTDQGEPYYPRGTQSERLPDALKELAIDLPKHVIPETVNFLIATADVQKNRWEIQITGVGPGAPFALTVIDRFPIVKSKRLDDEGDPLWVKPAAFLEDWALLETEVLEKRYETHDGGSMGVAFLGCDSGGREGVTEKAYDWFRQLRKKGAGEHNRVFLIKGDHTPASPRTRISYPDSARKDRKAAARGEIPVLLLNVNMLKDQMQNMLERNDTTIPAITYPAWLPDDWFNEMCAERRTVKGWENPRKARNEAWDLTNYAIGICVHKKVDRLNWEDPPAFAAQSEKNPYLVRPSTNAQKSLDKSPKGQYSSLRELAATLT